MCAVVDCDMYLETEEVVIIFEHV